MKLIRTLAAIALAGVTHLALAQGNPPPPQNVLQLSATGTVEVQQDLLSMSLSTTREGNDAAAVQAQVRSAVDAALADVRKTMQPGQLDVRTGSFGLSPRYTRDGRINGWQGSAEVILEGRDFPRITQAAARVTTLTVANVSFGLSREQRNKVESEAQTLAIENFKQKAAELAKDFGFGGYSLREVSVNASAGMSPRPRMMAMEASSKLSSDAAVPVEAGKSSVVVNVSGTVQLK